jgi:hypothetical protein
MANAAGFLRGQSHICCQYFTTIVDHQQLEASLVIRRHKPLEFSIRVRDLALKHARAIQKQLNVMIRPSTRISNECRLHRTP